MRVIEKLSARKVETITKPGRYGDGGNLWLQVTASSSGDKKPTKAWLFCYQHAGRARQMGLGPLHTISLKMARQRALIARQQVKDGVDPIEQKHALRMKAKVAAASTMTFKRAAERFIESQKAGWKNEKHADQWTATLDTYAYPIIGALPVASVDTGLVMKVLEPIWTKVPETASRTRGRIEAVLNWAAVREYRSGENPARWRGHLDKLLPKRSKVAKVKHMPALAYAEVGALMAELREKPGTAAKALEFTILCATRTTETICATWAEFDLDAKVWTIPEGRTKGSREHRVPLAARAVEILKALPRKDDNAHVFIGGKRGHGLSNNAMLKLLKQDMGRGEITTHGFRSTFRDWGAECTAYPNEMLELALAHAVSDKTEAAYRRGTMFEKRRRLMEDWATYCAQPGHKPAEATPIRAAA